HRVEAVVPRLPLVRTAVHLVAAEEVVLRPTELVLAHAILAHALDLLQEPRFGLCGVLGRAAEIEYQRARLVHRLIERRPGLSEPATVAELDEEPPRHAAAEHRAEHLHGRVI